MAFSNLTKSSSGEILTGKLWRKNHGFFSDLPFYCNIPRMEEMGGPLREALNLGKVEERRIQLLEVSKLAISYPPNLKHFQRN